MKIKGQDHKKSFHIIFFIAVEFVYHDVGEDNCLYDYFWNSAGIFIHHHKPYYLLTFKRSGFLEQ